MAVQPSGDATFEISANGSTWTTIGGVKSHNLAKRSTSAMVNNYDTTHEQVYHSKDGTDFNFTYDRDASDNGQQLLETARAAQRAGTRYYLRAREDVGAPAEEIFGLCFIEAIEPSGSDGQYNQNRCAGKWALQPTIQAQT